MANYVAPYEGNEPFVFVSYAHKDSATVEPLIRGLLSRGVRVWYDAGLEAGADWLIRIGEQLERSSSVVAFVSRNYEESHNCRSEISFAIEERKNLVIVYLEPRENLNAGMRMHLCSFHALYYFRYEKADAFLDALVGESVLKPAVGSAEPEKICSDSRPITFDTIVFSDEGKNPAEVTPDDSSEEMREESFAQNAEGWFAYAEKLWNAGKFDTAVAWYRKAAEQDHAQAQCKLGFCYLNGNGVQRNDKEALLWLRRAIANGDGLAIVYLGWCYETGRGAGLDKDFRKALELYYQAKEKGVSEANAAIESLDQREKGNKNYCGIRAKMLNDAKNYQEAVVWYRRIADFRDMDAQFLMGQFYYSGKGVGVDFSEAAAWYHKAAVQCHAEAQVSLAEMFRTGRGVPESAVEAVRWYKRAAQQSHVRAQWRLALCYEKGHGVDKDLKAAIAWYRKAQANGWAAGKGAIARCEAQLMVTQ